MEIVIWCNARGEREWKVSWCRRWLLENLPFINEICACILLFGYKLKWISVNVIVCVYVSVSVRRFWRQVNLWSSGSFTKQTSNIAKPHHIHIPKVFTSSVNLMTVYFNAEMQTYAKTSINWPNKMVGCVWFDSKFQRWITFNERHTATYNIAMLRQWIRCNEGVRLCVWPWIAP